MLYYNPNYMKKNEIGIRETKLLDIVLVSDGDEICTQKSSFKSQCTYHTLSLYKVKFIECLFCARHCTHFKMHNVI